MAKILLVEDDNNLREIYEARLQAEGYTIVTAQDGEEALVTAKNEKPDLVISDVMMPKISGFEMLDILRNTDGLKEVKVIMLTALGQSDDQQRADRLGADRYLVKSQVTLEDIVKVSHELLEDQATPTPAPAAEPAAETPAPVVATAPTETAPAPLVEPTAPVTAPVAPVAVAPEPATPVAAMPTPDPVVPAPIVADTPAVATPPAPEPVVTEPVAVTPMSAPEPLTPPVADTSAPSPVAPPSVDAQTSVQEEAGVEEKIEDFVSGATTDAAPVVPVASDNQTAAAPSQSQTAAASDDAVMNQALNDIIASAPETAPVAPEPAPAAPQPVEATPAVAPAPVMPSPAPVTVSPDPEVASNDHVEIAHKKVIAPLDASPKQDINELLAIEEAKEAAAAGPALPTAVVATNETPAVATPLTPASTPAPVAASFAPTSSSEVEGPSGGPAPAGPPAPGSTAIDPNSIAL